MSLCGVTVSVIENMKPRLPFQFHTSLKITDQTLLVRSNEKPPPQVQEVLDDSPFFVREDGVSIMNGANEGTILRFQEHFSIYPSDLRDAVSENSGGMISLFQAARIAVPQ